MKPYLACAEDAESSPSPTVDREQEVRRLVEDYLPLVAHLVDRTWVASRLGLTRDDLLSAGAYGLLMAARRFDPQRGVAFAVFARWHVRGALLREIKVAVQAAGSAEDQVLVPAADAIEPDSLPDPRGLSPGATMEASEVRELMEYMLNQEERLTLTLYYFEELTLTEAAEVLNSSKSGVARTIKTALGKLRAALSEETGK